MQQGGKRYLHDLHDILRNNVNIVGYLVKSLFT